MKEGISIIICTFNGESRLADTMKHICEHMLTSHIELEVILVDNGSTDGGPAIALDTWRARLGDDRRFIIVTEPTPGKIFALEAGFNAANFEFAIICDDDNWLSADYINRVFKILKRNPKIGAVGGRGIPIAEGELPEWFDSFEQGYACGPQGTSTGIVSERGHLWGAGMGTRTLLYRRLYANHPSLLTGRKGATLSAGEDAEYSQRLILCDYDLYYDSSLVFYHYMPNSRLTETYRNQLFAGFGESEAILTRYYLANSVKQKVSRGTLSKLRLYAVSLARYLLATRQKDKDKQRDILIFLSSSEVDKNSIMGRIKSFYTDCNNASIDR